MNNVTWPDTFLELFERCDAEYSAGRTQYSAWFSPADLAFLNAIGCNTREFFDLVEDSSGGDLSPAAALLITAVRRDYFLVVQKGVPSTNIVRPSDLPAKSDEVDGIRWLPRIIAKARAKLRGEMDPELMYSCGGDRAFFEQHNINGADFLRHVWSAGGDDRVIIDYVKDASRRS